MDSILIQCRDETKIPPPQLLRLYVHGGEEPMLSLQACESSEGTDEYHLEVLASFGIGLQDLVDAVNLLSDDGPLLQVVKP